MMPMTGAAADVVRSDDARAGAMTTRRRGEGSSAVLARRALIVAASLGFLGSGVGVVAVFTGAAARDELVLIASCMAFTAGALVALLAFRTIPLQAIATASTLYFEGYLCAGTILAIVGPGSHADVFVYLAWFFPLLVFNQLVNSPRAARVFGRSMQAAPLIILAGLAPRIVAVMPRQLQFIIIAYCVSYVSYSVMLNIVTKYREKYIVERERAESLRMQAQLLESISDCFISLDDELRVVYINAAACAELGIDRETAFAASPAGGAQPYLSPSMLAGLRSAVAAHTSATSFEAFSEDRDRWYDVRWFPRDGGMSIFFRNSTAAHRARQQLAEAHDRLSEQAALLDKAQDAIFVADMQGRIIYWNKGAERLYGWTFDEVNGRALGELFGEGLAELDAATAAVRAAGEWNGELALPRRDGRKLVVESRFTLVSATDGRPRSMLAITTDVTNRKAAEVEIAHLALHDALTQLPNRMLLRERLNRAIAAASPEAGSGALLFIDLDDFKTLNDTLGHDVGDLLLQQVAVRLTSCVRASDTVARLGGDEFVIVCEGLSADLAAAALEAQMIGEAVRTAFAAPFVARGFEHETTVSIGITMLVGGSQTADDLLKRADLAMYRAKAQGRNRVCFFDPGMETHAASRATLQSDLRRAIGQQAFELHFQPQVDRSGRVVGAEALLRWRHAEKGMIPPADFIPLAEEAGLIVPLGRWALETACAQLALWRDRPGLAGVALAVNVSPRQLLDANVVPLVRDLLAASGADPRRLRLEITESCVMENIDDAIFKLAALKALGVGVSLDDFGTGYSCLAHLTRLPLDELKIDRRFVEYALVDAKVASIVRTIITLARNLNLAVIAEGVETADQRAFLEAEGCSLHQGYLFSPALTPPAFEAFALQHAGPDMPAKAS